jgi:hypothetical protein
MTDSGLENLNKALRLARKAFVPYDDKAYEKALKAEQDRKWSRYMDRASRIIAKMVGVELK